MRKLLIVAALALGASSQSYAVGPFCGGGQSSGGGCGLFRPLKCLFGGGCFVNRGCGVQSFPVAQCQPAPHEVATYSAPGTPVIQAGYSGPIVQGGICIGGNCPRR